jgi:hypothetical protein
MPRDHAAHSARTERPARPAPAARASAALALAVGTLLAAGCTPPQPAPLDTAPPESVTPAGVPFDLFVHCGVDELVVDDRWYQRVGGPYEEDGRDRPPGWGFNSESGRLLVEDDLATFTDEQGHVEVFELREGATGPLMVCA